MRSAKSIGGAPATGFCHTSAEKPKRWVAGPISSVR